jgi:hypothetical protein
MGRRSSGVEPSNNKKGHHTDDNGVFISTTPLKESAAPWDTNISMEGSASFKGTRCPLPRSQSEKRSETWRKKQKDWKSFSTTR